MVGNSYVVEDVHQRRKLEMQSSVLQENNHSDPLLDKLLVEILCRVPCSKVANQCKCVCKRWAKVISGSSFVSRFVAFRMEGGGVPCVEEGGSSSNSSIMVPVEECMMARRVGSGNGNDRVSMETKKELEAFAIVARVSSISSPKCSDTWKGLMVYLRDPILNPKSFTYSSLPSLEVGDGTPLTVVGAFSDLLLYSRCESKKHDYYISNVRTKEWVVLPSPSFYYDTFIFTGFSCDPYYYFADNKGDGNHDVIVNSAYRFSVVVVPYKREASTRLSAHMISSETRNQWTDIILSLPTSCRIFIHSTGFCFGGNLHFLCSEGIIGFDPYGDQNDDGVIECHFIAWPTHIFYISMLRVGAFKGHLRVATFEDDRTLVVWVLQDYAKGEWSLQHSIALKEWVPRDVSLVHSFLGFILGFHPTDSDVIYLLNGDWVILCNLSTRMVEVAAHIPTCSGSLHKSFYAYPMMLPSWPTPLPTLAIIVDIND